MEKKTGPVTGVAGDFISDLLEAQKKNKAASQSKYGFKAKEGWNIPFLTPLQAAQQLGISVKTLERMRKDGTGPAFVKISNKRIRYSIVALDAWIEAQTSPQK